MTTQLFRRLAVRALALAAGGAAVATAAAPADAAVDARASRAVAATSASWGASGAPIGGAAVTGSPYVVNWNAGAIGAQYFQIRNTGSVALTGQTYTATNSKTTNGQVPPVAALDACVGSTWTVGVCTGTVVRLATSDAGPNTVTTAIAAGGALSVRIQPVTLANFPQSYTTSISVSVTRTQARAATTTRS